ncbi:hypothetical protein [Kutzneria sp. 744]|uniref:hypothetical protein n=1 Tax=Kutzneria sp. (strain 744) TaxID=345341 RepID=UPI0004B795FD|nr:hypothetical protein [Kutzneria sp. 744]
MATQVRDLVDELKTLRKGRGLSTGLPDGKVGPAVRALCSVTAADSPSVARKKIADLLGELAGRLPDDLSTAVLAAFGLVPEARQQFYKERVRWAALRIDRDERTVRRRIDQGIQQLAELSVDAVPATRPAAALYRWYNEEVRVYLTLDRSTPESLEFRRITSCVDNLRELDLALTLTAPLDRSSVARELDIQVVSGGTLVRKQKEKADRFAFSLRMPDLLNSADRHEYGLRFRVPDGQKMQPHYVCVPKQRCDNFQLHVRFDHDHMPVAVWLLSDAFQRDVDDPVPSGESLALDEAGELHLSFEDLTPGLAYGIRWDFG